MPLYLQQRAWSHRIISQGLWCYSCGWHLIGAVGASRLSKGSGWCGKRSLEKPVCLLLVHEPLQPAPCILRNVPLDGAGLDVELWDCVPVQASLPAVTLPASMGLERAYTVSNLKKKNYLLDGGIQPIYSAQLHRCSWAQISSQNIWQDHNRLWISMVWWTTFLLWRQVTLIEGRGRGELAAASQKPESHVQHSREATTLTASSFLFHLLAHIRRLFIVLRWVFG